jgi:hypothetical protein
MDKRDIVGKAKRDSGKNETDKQFKAYVHEMRDAVQKDVQLLDHQYFPDSLVAPKSLSSKDDTRVEKLLSIEADHS